MSKQAIPPKSKAVPVRETGAAGWWLPLLLGLGLLLLDPTARDPYYGPRFSFLAFWLLPGLALLMMGRKTLEWQLPKLAKFFFLNALLLLVWEGLAGAQSINVQESILALGREALFFLSTGLLFIWFQVFGPPSAWVWRVFSLLLILQIAVGIGQQYNWAFTWIPGFPYPVGTAGNRNLYASLLVLLFFISAESLFRTDNIWWRRLSLAALALTPFSLLIAQTRSAWLAWIFGLVVFDLSLLAIRRHWPPLLGKRLLQVHLAGFALVLITGLLVLQTDRGGELAASIRSRLASLVAPSSGASDIAGKNVNERLFVWEKTLDLIQEKPLLGHGPGNWRLVFPKVGGASTADLEGGDKLRVRPHNVYLHVASESGWPGLLLFCGLGALLFAAGWQTLRQASGPGERLAGAGRLAALSALAVDMVFSFPLERMEHLILTVFLAAWMLDSYRRLPAVKAQAASLRPAGPFLLALVPVLLFLMVLGWHRWRYDRQVARIIAYDTAGQPEQVLQAAARAQSPWVNIDPVADPLEFHRARAYQALGQYEQALEEIRRAKQVHPNNHRVFNTEGAILIKQKKYAEALPVLEKALSLSEAYEPALFNLAFSHYQLGQGEKSLSYLNQIPEEQRRPMQELYLAAVKLAERQAMETNPLFKAVMYVQEQIDQSRKQIDGTPLFEYHEKVGSDTAFVGQYFRGIAQFVVFRKKWGGGSPEQLEALQASCRRALEVALQAPDPRATAEAILRNDHRKTVVALNRLRAADIRRPSDVLFPL